jgi:hypothetical protein
MLAFRHFSVCVRACVRACVRVGEQVWALAQHQYVQVWKHLQDAVDNVMMHLARKPRFAMSPFEPFPQPRSSS